MKTYKLDNKKVSDTNFDEVNIPNGDSDTKIALVLNPDEKGFRKLIAYSWNNTWKWIHKDYIQQ